MKRRSFLGALAAAFTTPLQMLQPPEPVAVDCAWVPTDDYLVMVHPHLAQDLAAAGVMTAVLNHQLMSGYIGHFEGVRFVASDLP